MNTNKLIYSVIIVIPLLLSGASGQAQGQTSNVNVFVVVTPTTYQLDLKAIEGEIPTRNFVTKPQSVVQVKQGDNLVVATQPITQIVESVKVQDSKGVMTTLRQVGNEYSLAGLPTGAYILDVIVDLGSNKKGAYETILVILAQGQQPLPPQQIIQKVQISDDITIIFPPVPPPEVCEPGFVLVGDNCEPICPEPEGSDQDSNGRDCEPIDPIDPIVCEPGFVLEGDNCVPIDEPIVCEPGFVDNGNGCEPIEEPIELPGIVPPEVPPDDGQGDQGGEDNDNGNGDDSQPDPQPEPDPSEDNQGGDTDTG